MSTKSLLEVTEAPATGLITMNHKKPGGKIFKRFDDDFFSFMKVFKTHISGLEGFKKCRAKGAVSKIQNIIADRKKVIKQQGCKYVNQSTYLDRFKKMQFRRFHQ